MLLCSRKLKCKNKRVVRKLPRTWVFFVIVDNRLQTYEHLVALRQYDQLEKAYKANILPAILTHCGVEQRVPQM